MKQLDGNLLVQNYPGSSKVSQNQFLGFMIESIIHELLRHRKDMQALKNESMHLLLQRGKKKRKRKKDKKNAASSPSLLADKDEALQEPEPTT